MMVGHRGRKSRPVPLTGHRRPRQGHRRPAVLDAGRLPGQPGQGPQRG
jgi:hypothetical protein